MGQQRASSLRAALGALLLALVAGRAYADGVVNVYTARHPNRIQPALDAFTKDTGVATQLLFLDTGLAERLALEGDNSPADVIFATSLSQLAAAKDAGALQAPNDDGLTNQVPAPFRDADGQWFALGLRPLSLAALGAVPDATVPYAALGDTAWRGRLCAPFGTVDERETLLAAALSHWGPERTQTWAAGVSANLAKPGNACDLALATLEPEASAPQATPSRAWRPVAAVWENGQTQADIAGVGLGRVAPHRDDAIKLLRFLASDRAQALLSEAAGDAPVAAPANAPSSPAAGPALDATPLSDIAKQRAAAVALAAQTGLGAP